MDYKIFDAKDITLENGLRVVTIKRNTQIASIHCGVKAGSIYEKRNEKGISHFIEHMLFKGTAKRDNEKLNSDLENLGGEYNAYTDFNCTVYSITALQEELNNAVELMADMLLESTFPKGEIEKERGVILAEIRTSKDDIEDYSFRRVNSIAFESSPLKYDIIGEESTVKKFSKSQLEKYYKRFYRANNSFLTIVSSFEHDEILDIVKKYFSAWDCGEFPEYNLKAETNIPKVEVTFKREIEQSTITYLYTFHNLEKDDEMALKILNHKLGESANSILFRELREEKGLAYDVYTHLDMSNQIKTLYIYTAVSEESIDEALEIIDGCISRIKDELVVFNDQTIGLMKKVLRTALAATMEDSTDLCNYVLHQCIDGEDIYEFMSDMRKMESIKRDDIYRVARLVLNNPTIHILRPEP